uniref:Uncharacterized protein n=1 Tax=Trichobilharzia regenti TaxID=157069 RepID=A0AA85KI46_TRIRE|nr:unnamed protein product [Trichobilharzia regenti]
MLFNWLVVILFLQAYDYVNAEWDVFDEKCEEKCSLYNLARSDCGRLCSKATGAQTFYCTLGCAKNSSTAEDYETCKGLCKAENLTKENCKVDCELTTESRYICDTVCADNVAASLPRCLFYCAKSYPPKVGCVEKPDKTGRECENPNLYNCTRWCYDGDWKRINSNL